MSETVFTTGGPVHPDYEKIYIQRKADKQLLKYCLEGEYSVVLTARQMGKTSLLYHTIRELKQYDVATVYIDLNKIGTGGVSADDWFKSILDIIREDLSLDFDIETFWSRNSNLAHGLRFSRFLRDVLLKNTNKQIVIFIDEIELTTQLEFSDSFFSVIRSLYTARAANRAVKRLCFVLAGMARISDLIKQPDITTFNIGRRVDLENFSNTEILPLLQQVPHPINMMGQLADWIMEWTGGQPFLTQVICEHISQYDIQIEEKNQIRDIVIELLKQPEIQDKHINTIQRYLLGKPSISIMLGIYAHVLSGKTVPNFDGLLAIQYLKLAGVLVADDEDLKISNRIYAQVFDYGWVEKQLGSIHTPLHVALELAQTSIEGTAGHHGDVVQKATAAETKEAVRSNYKDKSAEAERVSKRPVLYASNNKKFLIAAAVLGIIVLVGLIVLVVYIVSQPIQAVTPVTQPTVKPKIFTVQIGTMIWFSIIILVAALGAGLYTSIATAWESYYRRYGKNNARITKEQRTQFRKDNSEFWKQKIRKTSTSDKVAAELAQADIKFKVAEYYAMVFISTESVAVIFYSLSQMFASESSITYLIVGSVVGFFVPRIYVKIQQQNRLSQFVQEMPDALQLMISGIRSGYSTLQSVENTSRALSGPISDEFRRMALGAQMNISESQLFSNLLYRIPSSDLGAFVASIELQRKVGGKLADALEVISSQMKEKAKQFSLPVSLSQPFLIAFLEYVLIWGLLGNYVSTALATPLGYWLSILNMILLSFSIIVIARLYPDEKSLIYGFLLIAGVFLTSVSSDAFFHIGIIFSMIFLYEPFFWFARKITPTSEKLVVGSVLIVVLGVVGLIFSSMSSVNNESIIFSTYPILGIILLIMVMTLAVVVVGQRADGASDKGPLQARMAEFSVRDNTFSFDEVELSQPFAERVLIPMVDKAGEAALVVTPQADFNSIERKLEESGQAGWIQVPVFMSLRLVLALAGAWIPFLFVNVQNSQEVSGAIGVSLFLFIAGFVAPHMWLDIEVSKRKEEIVYELPHAVNLLWICSDVGLSLTASIKTVFESWDSAIAIEFGRVEREVQLGKGIRDALDDMANRLQIPEISNFVSTLIQSDLIGTSLSNTLRAFYDQLITTQSSSDKNSSYIVIFASMGLSVVIWIALLVLGQVLLVN